MFYSDKLIKIPDRKNKWLSIIALSLVTLVSIMGFGIRNKEKPLVSVPDNREYILLNETNGGGGFESFSKVTYIGKDGIAQVTYESSQNKILNLKTGKVRVEHLFEYIDKNNLAGKGVVIPLNERLNLFKLYFSTEVDEYSSASIRLGIYAAKDYTEWSILLDKNKPYGEWKKLLEQINDIISLQPLEIPAQGLYLRAKQVRGEKVKDTEYYRSERNFTDKELEKDILLKKATQQEGALIFIPEGKNPFQSLPERKSGWQRKEATISVNSKIYILDILSFYNPDDNR